jgi:hypothetical protein
MPASGNPVRIKAGGNAADAFGGSGAISVEIFGLNESFIEVTETIIPSGTGVSQPTSGSFWRVYRAGVVDVGTYGAANIDDIVIENSNGSSDRLEITADEGQTQHCAYSIPSGSIGYLMSMHAHVDGGKAADIRVFSRENLNVVISPMTSKRLKLYYDGVLGTIDYLPDAPNIILPPLTDVWVEARGGGANTEVSVDMEILIIETAYAVEPISALFEKTIAEFDFFPDAPPTIVGELTTGLTVNIQLWEDGVPVSIASSGCSEIDDTGMYGWSVGSGISVMTNRRRQFHWRMTDGGIHVDQGDFSLLATASDDGNMPPLNDKGSYIIGS